MFDDFLLRAALAGIGLALAAGPLGAFVVWRQMAYFGDATAHAAILGVALSLGFSTSIYVGTLLTALAMALTISGLSRRGHGMDTLLGVLSYSALALGLVAISFVSGVRVDLASFLFGDILAVSKPDLATIWVGSAAVVVLLVWRWQALLTATLNRDLAYASGINPDREQVILSLALALVVAVAIKVVGALLIGAMLIIPAAAARGLTRSPETMAVTGSILAVLAVLGGLAASMEFDTPAGPSIVSAAGFLFALSLIFGPRFRRRRHG